MNQYDTFTFGQHRGIEIGVVYLFDSDYIDWALRITSHFFLTDLEELRKIKCLQILNYDESLTVGFAGRNLVFNDYVPLKFTYVDLKYTGIYQYQFSQEAIEKNEIKLKRFGDQRSKYVDIDYNDKVIFVQLLKNGYNLFRKVAVKYTGVFHTRAGFDYHRFTFNNLKNTLNIFPPVEYCHLGLFELEGFNLPINIECNLVFENSGLTIQYEPA